MTEKVAIIEEALALEKAGANWETKHVAALVNRSRAYIRYSDCPKHTEPPGPRSRKGRGKPTYVPAEVRDWMKARLDREHEPRVKLAKVG